MPEPTTKQPETELVSIALDDRLNRRIILSVDHWRRCVIAAWVDEELNVPVARTYSGTALYNLLAKPTPDSGISAGTGFSRAEA